MASQFWPCPQDYGNRTFRSHNWALANGKRIGCRAYKTADMSANPHEATAICSVAGNMLCEAFRQAFRRRPAKGAGRSAHQRRKDSFRISRNVAVIKFSHTLPFNGDCAETNEATGFVVDAKRGYKCRVPRQVDLLIRAF